MTTIKKYVLKIKYVFGIKELLNLHMVSISKIKIRQLISG